MMPHTAQSISRAVSSLNSRGPVGPDRWVLTGLRHEILGDGGKLLKVLARGVLDLHREPAGCTQPSDRGGVEGEDQRLRDLREFPEGAVDERLDVLIRARAFVPEMQGGEDDQCVKQDDQPRLRASKASPRAICHRARTSLRYPSHNDLLLVLPTLGLHLSLVPAPDDRVAVDQPQCFDIVICPQLRPLMKQNLLK